MRIFDIIFMLMQIAFIAVWFLPLVMLLKRARNSSATAPWPVLLSCVLLCVAAVSWVLFDLVLESRGLDVAGGVEVARRAITILVVVGYLAVSLLQGGRVSYWLMLMLAVPAFFFVSGATVFFGGQLFPGGWLGTLGWLGWLSCATALTLLLLGLIRFHGQFDHATFLFLS